MLYRPIGIILGLDIRSVLCIIRGTMAERIIVPQFVDVILSAFFVE